MSDTLSAVVVRSRRPTDKPALFVGLVADMPRTPGMRLSLGAIDRVDIVRGHARGITRTIIDGSRVLTLSLADPRVSTKHARLAQLGGTWVLDDCGSKNGTWVGAQRISRKPLLDGEAFVVGHTALVLRERGGEDVDFSGTPPELVSGLVTFSPELAERYRALASAARSAVPIQISGATGSGKELVARGVHAASGRTGRFVAVNCGALPATLLEAELFGHQKGAFTGATDDRPGLIRSADRGTLFLDEIAELPPPAQAALLRVLQEGEVLPVGGDTAVNVDVRIVTATHRDLDADVAANRFRADLRARLLGVEVNVPPLRDRLEDLVVIANTLLDKLAPGRAITLSVAAVAALYAHEWPLNIRELERALAGALAVARDCIDLEHLPARIADVEPDEEGVVPAEPAGDVNQTLRAQLAETIARHGGNLAAVARELGKDRTQIRRWMRRFGLSRET